MCNFNMAKRHYEKAISIDKNHIDSYCSIGTVYALQDDRNKAFDVLRKAHSLQPSHTRILENFDALSLNE